MSFVSRINFFSLGFCLSTLFGHQRNYENFDRPIFNHLEQANHIINEVKKDTDDTQSDEGSEKEQVFLNKKIDALKEFDEIKKRLPIQTLLGQAIWADRIQHPINNCDVLEERQNVIAFLIKNPDLLDKIKLLLATITPQIEQTLFEDTVDKKDIDKTLYCKSSFIPASIANKINKRPFLLALWQVVPHCAGFIITLFDPALHWFGFSECHDHAHGNKKSKKESHGHSHEKKENQKDLLKRSTELVKLTKTATERNSLKRYLPRLKRYASYISLIKTTIEAIQNIGHYGINVSKNYQFLFKKAHALHTIITATEKINQIIGDAQPLTPIKQSCFEQTIQKLVCSIKNTYNIGSLAQLQYLLSNKKTTADLKKMLYFVGKADLYVSLATALLQNKITLCSYKTGNNPILILKQGIGSTESAHKVPNDYLYTQQPTIITGPGGSGKSEYLAMIIANSILAQSLGIIPQAGSSECSIIPLDYIIIHSNITDTRGVESTSQAEAGRLKQYNDYLQNNPNSKGIIVFDELLKHSKPQIAEFALVSLVAFFNQYPHLITLYSTHFQAISEIENTQQLSTKTIQTETGDTPTYQVIPGCNNSCSIIAQLSNALGEKFVFLNKNK